MSDISPRHLSNAKSVNRALLIAVIGLGVGLVLWLHAAGSNPIASFTATPSIGQAPLTVAFDASATTDPENDPITFQWAFGDGNTATGALVSNTYAQPGLYTATLTATDGLGGTGTASRTISVSDIPSGWQASTIGAPAVPATAWTTQSNSVWHLTGAGLDVAGTSDQCAYLHQTLANDADIVVRVNAFDPTNGSTTAKAGIMLRTGLDANSPMVYLYRQPNNVASFSIRKATNGTTTVTSYGIDPGPAWLRLKRRGNLLSASVKTFGEWFPLGYTIVPMPTQVNAGLAVVSRSATALCHVTFDNLRIENNPDAIPDLQTIWRQDGSATSHRYGWWTDDGPRLVAISNALARAEYTLTVPAPGVYRVSLTVGNSIQTNDALFGIQALIDAIPVTWLHAFVPAGTQTTTVAFWTPYIGHTNLTLRFAWPEQLNAGQRLVIHEAGVAAPGPSSGWLDRIVQDSALFGLDSDNDRLLDSDEMLLGADPMNPDADGDLLHDGDEVHKFGTDPVNPDSDNDGIPDGSILAAKPAVQYSDLILGRKPWFIIDDMLVNFDSHSRAYYTFDIPEGGVYRIFVRFHNYQGEGPDGYYWQTSFYNDDIYILSTYLPNRQHADCDLSLPTYMDTMWLTPGSHTVGFKWWNNYTVGYRDLNVAADEVGLIRIDAPDADSDGIQDWMEPSLEALRTLDRDGDGLNDYDEVVLYNSSPTLSDTDGDGLNDAREIALGTNPNDADSDHDGVTDSEEAEELHTNPLQPEFDGTVQTVAVIPGAATNIALGAWVTEGSEILAQNRRGFVEYTLNVATSDCYRIQSEATHIWRKSLCSPALPEDASDLLVYLDGRLLSIERLVAPDGIYETVQFFTPYLTPGTYTLRYFWENVHERISLKIKETRVQRLGGPDANANGIKDWIEASLSALSTLELPIWYSIGASSLPSSALPVSSSFVSPICLEGHARYVDMMTLGSGTAWSDGFESYPAGQALHGINGWKGWDNNPAWGATASSNYAASGLRSVAVAPASDLVHEYSGATNGQWVYSIRQYIPANFTGRQYFILLNDYVDAARYNWSVQVYFDAGQNLVRSDYDGANRPLVKGRWVDIRVEIDLDADTQSFWYDNQKLYQKSWRNGVSGNGAKNIAAIDLYGNGASPVYYDDARLVPVTLGLAGTLPLVANPAPDDRWYADLPLAPTGATRVAVGFQNNAFLREALVEWVPLNMLDMAPGSVVTIRKNDAVKLTAYPAGASGGTVTIACNGQSAVTDLTTPTILSFTNAGTYTVTGTWTPVSGSPVSGSLSVKVLGGSFPTNPAACLLNVARVWACTNLPVEVVVSAGESNKTVLTQQLLAQGRNLTLTRKDVYRPDYVVARIGQGGPILCSQKIEPFTLRAAVDGFFWVAETYPDGRQLWYNLITAARLPATVQLQIQVIVGGVTLDDLTTQRWINRSNLTDLDEYNIGLIRSPGLTTSSCHTLRAYQDGVYLGEATYY